MKNLLRKLHLVGSRDDQQGDTTTSSAFSLTDWFWSLVKPGYSERINSSTSAPPRTSTSTSPTPPGSSSSTTTTATAGAAAPPSGFDSIEEEYQLQLAIALSVSDDQSVDSEVAEIEAVKRISLGLSPASVSGTQAELAAYRYWAYDVLNYDDRVLDGFYDLYGVACDSSYPSKLPSLNDLQGEPVSSLVTREVVLVNRATDSELVRLEKSARSALAECTRASTDPVQTGLAQRIALIVAGQMGGAVGNDVELLSLWRTTSWELRSSLRSNVLPVGYLQVGLARHRALLFKVLADCVGISCRLVKGRHYTGAEEGAVNIIKDSSNREYIIDLMGAPGVLIPPDGPAQTEDRKKPMEGVNLAQRHHSEPADIEVAVATSVTVERRSAPSHVRSPSWTEGIGAPGARQSKAKDMSQYVIEAAQENPALAQKLHDVLLESGYVPPEFLTELSPKELNQKKDPEENTELRRGLNRVSRSKDKGKPPLPVSSKADEVVARERLQRLKSVEGLGERRPLESLSGSSSVTTASSVATAAVLSAVHENLPVNLMKNSPVAASAITAAVVASSMVVAAAKSDSETNFEVPITAAATATAAVVAATSAAAVLKSESGSDHSDRGGSGRRKHEDLNFSSSNPEGKANLRSSVMQDVAEWEIPWEELVVGERIGLGSYGEVYRGDWRGTAVAIKKFLDQDISGDALAEFITEVRLMKRMRHPNVVLFMGAVTRPPTLSIVTEFLPRGSLFKLLHRPSCQLDERRRLRMALDVAKGMNYLHSSNPMIVHRDLKSPNLLVDKNWVVKVCDFGLSRIKHQTFLSSKSQAGTPEWMAPEVLRNEPSNEKSDVYSFGVILWELATLQQPWHGMNPMQVVGAVGFQGRRLDIPSHVDPAIAKIIEDCWQSDPQLRPSFADIMRALRPFQKPVIPSQITESNSKQKVQQRSPTMEAVSE